MSDLILPSAPDRVGLRFPSSAERRLRELAEQYRGQQGIDIGLFEKAADSVRDKAPLDVHFSDREEVALLVGYFVALGVPEPHIEDQHRNY